MARKDAGEMYQRLFEGVAAAQVSIALLEEEVRRAEELITANGWPRDEGMHIIFANGLAYLEGSARLRQATESEGVSEEVERLTRELMDMHSKYAVMKFRAFSLDQAKQVLEMNVTGLEAENRASGSRIWKFREDEERLKGEVSRLKLENEQLRREIAVLQGTAEPERDRHGLLRRVFHAIKGRAP